MMLITQKWGKPMKVINCKHRFCLNCLAACFSSGKNEEEPQCPAFEINTLKADIHLICKLCCHFLKYNAAHVVKNFLSAHTIITTQNTYKIVH